MHSADDIFASLSGETKALILLSEFRLGRLHMEGLRTVLDVIARSDLERLGIVEMVRRQAAQLGVTPEQSALLAEALAAASDTGLTPIPIPVVDGPTVKFRRVDIPPMPEAPAPQPATVPQLAPSPFPTPPSPPAPKAPTPTPSFNVKRQEPIDIPTHPTSAIPPREHPPLRERVGSVTQTFYGGGIGGVPGDMLSRMSTRKVLLADDDKRIRMVFRKRLESSEYLVEEAQDGLEAWDKIEQGQFCAVVLDMKMPGLHGLQILERLAARGSSMPVVICSAYEQLREEFVVSTYPKLRYLVKPVPADALVTAIEELTGI